MVYRWVLVLGFLSIATNSLRADVLPFFPRDKVLIVLHFENLADHSDFDFYVKYGAGPKHERLELEKVRVDLSSARLFSWGRTKLGSAFLIAVPSGTKMPGNWEIRENADLIAKLPPGALESSQLKIEDGLLSEQENECEVVYTIRINGEKLSAEFVEVRRPKKFDWLTLGCLCIGVLASGVLAGIFIFRVRQGRTRT